jgi:hypothetical protein
MGRQHTTWISEENWLKLENIPGTSTSGKIGYAIDKVDPDHQMWVNAKMRQLETAKKALRDIAKDVWKINEGIEDNIDGVLDAWTKLLGEIQWLWEASA